MANQKIYILEGPDGTGKTTLANEIAKQRKASILHSYFDLTWDIEDHHRDMMRSAQKVARWMPVVLDRWAPSEFVYGTVFRGKPGYDVMDYLWMQKPELEKDVVWIYCWNKNAVENHLKNAEERDEMYDDMSKVVKLFDDFIEAEDDLGDRDWLTYNFDDQNMEEFVKELP